METFREYFVNKYGLYIKWENDCTIQYKGVLACQSCKSPFERIIYHKEAAKFICGKCGKNLFIETEQKWKESQDEWRKYFETEADMLAYNRTIAEEEFNKDVRTDLRIWGVGLHYSIMKWIAIMNGNKKYYGGTDPCGICFAMTKLNISCKECHYGKVFKLESYTCGRKSPDEMLASFENPEFLALVKAADDKLEAAARTVEITIPIIGIVGDGGKVTLNSIGEKLRNKDAKPQSEYLKCPECECDEFIFRLNCDYYTRIKSTGIRTFTLPDEKKYECINCKTALKFQSAQSGRLVKIESEGKNGSKCK